MKLTLLLIGFLLFAQGYGQGNRSVVVDTSAAAKQYWRDWYKDLYRNGVDVRKDSFALSPEITRIVKDTAYRNLLYPSAYTWQGVQTLLKHMEVKKAFWHMIKLYGADTANRRLVVGSLLAYSTTIDVERAVTSAYYTYAFLDPAVAVIKNNKPVFTRPDVLESELNDVKQMIMYVRTMKSSGQQARKEVTGLQ